MKNSHPYLEFLERNREDSQSGVALIIAIMVISIMVIFTADLIINSQVNLESSVGTRDRIKAEYIAKSGVNMAKFLISVDSAIDQVKKSMMQIPPSDGPSDAWTMLNGIPIGGDSAELLSALTSSFGLNKVQDEDLISQLSMLEGNFVLDITDEGTKLNLNLAAQGRGEEVKAILTSLMDCPAEKDFLSQKKVKAEELFFRIKDWIDDDKKAETQSGYNDESDPYRKKTPPYNAKNAPFDTMSELMMIDGWDQEIHVVFSPYLTVYPVQTDSKQKPKLNLNTIPRSVISCLFPKSDTDCAEKYDEALKLRETENKEILSNSNGVSQVLTNLFCASQKDVKEKSSWFTNQTNVFRILSTANVGAYTKNIEIILQRNAPVSSAGKADLSTETKNKLLYWKSF